MGVGVRHRGARPRRRPHLGHRPRRATTRPSRSGTTRSASRASASSGSTRTTSGRWATPARAARARRSSTTAGPSYGPEGGPENRRRRALRRDLEPRLPAVLRQPDGSLTDLAGAGHRHRRRARARCSARCRTSPSLYDDRRARRAGRRGAVASPAPPAASPTIGDIALRSLADHARTMTLPRQRRRHPVATRTAATCCGASSAAPIRFAYLLGVESDGRAAAGRRARSRSWATTTPSSSTSRDLIVGDRRARGGARSGRR